VVALGALVWAADWSALGYQNATFDQTINNYDYWITNPSINGGVIDVGCGVKYAWAASENTATGEIMANAINGIRLGPNTQTGSFEVGVYQTKMYFNGQLVEVPSATGTPPARVVATVNPSYGTTDPWTFLPMQQFFKEALPKDQTYKTGEFIVKITPKAGCGSTHVMYFTVKKFNSEGYPTTPPSGGPPSEGANGTEEEQQGFWTSLFTDLFVPSQEAIDDYVASMEQFTNWGPFGIHSFLTDDLWEIDGAQVKPYTLTFTLPMFGANEFVIDASPYEPFIVMWRWLMSASLWWTVFWRVYRRAIGTSEGGE
jgi:hypothetical protein